MVRWYSWTLNDVIADLAMGVKFDCLVNRKYHSWPSFMLMALKTSAIVNQMRRFGIWWFAERMIPKKQVEARDLFVKSSIEYTQDRIRLEAKRDDNARPDLIGQLLKETKKQDRPLTEPEIASEAAVLIAAGSETTSVLLSGLTYHLLRTPEAMTKLKAEIRSSFTKIDDINVRSVAKLQYLNLVIEEGLRIFGPASMVTHRVIPAAGHQVLGEWVPGHVSHPHP